MLYLSGLSLNYGYDYAAAVLDSDGKEGRKEGRIEDPGRVPHDRPVGTHTKD